MSGEMVPQQYPLWLVWDETFSGVRESHSARVLGWRTIADDDGHQLVFPVVLHPDTHLPATLGHDTAGSVSRMQTVDQGYDAVAKADVRNGMHEGRP